MSSHQMTDWERYALIVRVARTLGRGHSFGRKALQKVVYLLQEHAGIPANFRYTFYTYGVYSFELANTLSAVENMKGVDAVYDRAQNAYSLSDGEGADALERKGENLFNRHKARIEETLALAAGKTAKQLELITTIVYVAKNESLSAAAHEPELLARVKDLKPMFDREQIERQIADLRERTFLPPAKRKTAK